MIKLAIALPISDRDISTSFFLSWVMLEKPDDCHLVFPKMQFHNSDLGKIRDHLCKQAIDLGCTHILMMDTDQVYHDRDLISRLFAHGKDIVAGKVHRRYPPFEPILNIDGQHVPDSIIEQGGLIRVDATGTGCMLINLNVLEEIAYPWFHGGVKEDGSVIGEDVGFCYQAADAGYEIFVDCDVRIGHLAVMEVDASFYSLWKKTNKVKL